MMELDKENCLDKHPLLGIDNFIKECNDRGISEVNMTGTNTDPLLYTRTEELKEYLKSKIPNLVLGIRTNAVKRNLDLLKFYDKGSVTICSFDPLIYKEMMGKGSPPDFEGIVEATKHWSDLKVNIVLGPDNIRNNDFLKTIEVINSFGNFRINLREPYGQPHVGNPITMTPDSYVFGNPSYQIGTSQVTYWDVHYTKVESVNLYATGRVSIDYPITRGHSDTGEVEDQSKFSHGRHREQWVSHELMYPT